LHALETGYENIALALDRFGASGIFTAQDRRSVHAAMTGVAPHIPGLLGLPRDYLNAQLGAWKAGQRRAHAPDCMKAVVARLTLAGNRAVTLPQTANLVQIVLNGGYAPATQGNPRPFGMPPFVLVLSDSDVAALLTHIRSAWGNQAGAVTALEVNRIRSRRAP
jgi:hypothetical protein